MAVVRLTNEAVEDLRDLDGAARKVVAKALKKLDDEPEKRGTPLASQSTGNLTTFRKIVVGDRDYRIVYRVEPDGSVCVVWVIAKRADSAVYEMAISRLKLYGERSELAADLQRIVEDARRLTTR
jgi:mRNA interferase RelE/StbE